MSNTHYINQSGDHFIIVDYRNKFVCSAYTYEEALQDLTDLLIKNAREKEVITV